MMHFYNLSQILIFPNKPSFDHYFPYNMEHIQHDLEGRSIDNENLINLVVEDMSDSMECDGYNSDGAEVRTPTLFVGQ